MPQLVNYRTLTTVAAAVALAVATPASAATATDDVIANYADIAEAAFTDAHRLAGSLADAVGTLVAAPTADTLEQARQAWVDARVPYMQTEVYRFGNPIVDDWEGSVNAWPLDEGLIDYVDSSYGSDSEDNDFYTANVIANESMNINGQPIDASSIDEALLRDELHEAGGIEANVSIGYHAIEFLLWGQDLNGTDAGAGERPATDFDTADCSNGHCDRRATYLTTAADMLIADLDTMVQAWSPEGEARLALTEAEPGAALGAMLTGMGSLSYGELAGERMQLGLMLHDPEEEHDCFADNTAASHYYDGLGIHNVYVGRYERVDGDAVEGASLRALLAESDPDLADELGQQIESSVAALGVLLDNQKQGEAYDQLIAEGNDEGNAMVQTAIDALKDQTRNIERAMTTLDATNVSIEGSDSLDDPSAVFQ